jgi:hypothetical protein
LETRRLVCQEVKELMEVNEEDLPKKRKGLKVIKKAEL